jgi:methylthioxylose transferase
MSRSAPGAIIGTVVTLTIVAAAASVEAVSGFETHSYGPPLHAHWRPHLGPGTVPAVVVAAALVTLARRYTASLPWPWLLAAAWAASLAWILALALVDGVAGIADPPEHRYEYLLTARGVEDVAHLLQEFVSRIDYSAKPDNWPPHVAGHPPGALLFFVALVYVGIDQGLTVGLTLATIGATTPLAVAVTLRALGAEQAARQALPFLVVTPAAVWVGVTADGGVFAPAAAWGTACLAIACQLRSQAWALLAGLVLGACVYLSYGLLLSGILALAVLAAAGTTMPFTGAVAGALAVACMFFAAGYSWPESYAALTVRYFEGWGGERDYRYWVVGNLAAFSLSAGLLVGAALGHALTTARRRLLAGQPQRVVLILGSAGWLMVLAADLSGMSKAEVERIWLPFVPWTLLLVVLLPVRWQRWGLPAQATLGLLLQHLYVSNW